MNPKANAVLVEALGSALRYGGGALTDVPALLKQLLVEDAWREFVTPRGELVHHERFVDFVVTPPTAGMGASVDLVRRIVADDVEVLDLLDQALQNPTGKYEDDLEGVDNVHAYKIVRPTGNSESAALRRLRKDRPDLHAEVLAERLSAHAAMVKAGFRRKTQTIRLDNPESAAQTLRKHMPLEARQALARLLLEE